MNAAAVVDPDGATVVEAGHEQVEIAVGVVVNCLGLAYSAGGVRQPVRLGLKRQTAGVAKKMGLATGHDQEVQPTVVVDVEVLDGVGAGRGRLEVGDRVRLELDAPSVGGHDQRSIDGHNRQIQPAVVVEISEGKCQGMGGDNAPVSSGKPARPPVVKAKDPASGVSHDQIQVAVLVEVADRGVDENEIVIADEADLGCDLTERPVAIVAKNHRRHAAASGNHVQVSVMVQIPGKKQLDGGRLLKRPEQGVAGTGRKGPVGSLQVQTHTAAGQTTQQVDAAVVVDVHGQEPSDVEDCGWGPGFADPQTLGQLVETLLIGTVDREGRSLPKSEHRPRADALLNRDGGLCLCLWQPGGFTEVQIPHLDRTGTDRRLRNLVINKIPDRLGHGYRRASERYK